MVEHTHTFCEDETTHTHPSADHCLTILQLSQGPDQLPSPTNNDFQELKQYLTPMLSVASAVPSTLQQGDFSPPHLLGTRYLKAIFHPPIAA